MTIELSRTMAFFLPILALSTIATTHTEPVTLPDPQVIHVAAADGLLLVGSFYTMPDTQAPTVLLLHEPNASQANWVALVPPIMEAGYNALMIDLRGHGETGGEVNWEAAVDDIQTWLDWLREQPEVQTTGISIIGADLGGSLAVIGCENDTVCLTAVVVSPVGLGCADRDCSVEIEQAGEEAVHYLDALTVNTLTAPERRSSALLLSAPNDNLSIESLRQVSRYLSEQVQMAVTTGERHGTELLGASGSNALSTAIEWLDARTPTNLTPDEIEALVAAGDPNNGETLFAEGRPDLPLEEGTPCTHCHHADSEERDIGPGLLNISQYATNRVDGQSAAVYLYESIVAPDRYLVEGFSDSIMPPRYDKGFTEEQIGDLVAYLLSLES